MININLYEELKCYLEKKHYGVTLDTDIFEHAFLRFLDYKFVPEKCRFELEVNSDMSSISLRTPYGIDIREFIDGLKQCTRGTGIKVKELDPNVQQDRFCVRLYVPSLLIKDNFHRIFNAVDEILIEEDIKNFYEYWTKHAKEYNAALTFLRIKKLMDKKILKYPSLDCKDVWGAIIQEKRGKDVKINFLKKQVFNNINNFPKINLIYEENGREKEIVLTRSEIVKILEDFSFDYLLSSKAKQQEFLVTKEIIVFIEKKYNRTFSVNDEYNYKIDLGYHGEERNILEKKYGIKELSSYVPAIEAMRSHYYIYNKENYMRALLALKEIADSPCVEERFHQLTYYIQHQMWDKLETELKFLVNLNKEDGVNVDYTELLMRLRQYAMSALQEKDRKATLVVIEKVYKDLVNNTHLKVSDYSEEITNKLNQLIQENALLKYRIDRLEEERTRFKVEIS